MASLNDSVEEAVWAIKKVLQCPICLGTLRDPVLASCDHAFCRNCFSKSVRLIKPLCCPVCTKKLNLRGCGKHREARNLSATVIPAYLRLINAYNSGVRDNGAVNDCEIMESQMPDFGFPVAAPVFPNLSTAATLLPPSRARVSPSSVSVTLHQPASPASPMARRSDPTSTTAPGASSSTDADDGASTTNGRRHTAPTSAAPTKSKRGRPPARGRRRTAAPSPATLPPPLWPVETAPPPVDEAVPAASPRLTEQRVDASSQTLPRGADAASQATVLAVSASSQTPRVDSRAAAVQTWATVTDASSQTSAPAAFTQTAVQCGAAATPKHSQTSPPAVRHVHVGAVVAVADAAVQASSSSKRPSQSQLVQRESKRHCLGITLFERLGAPLADVLAGLHSVGEVREVAEWMETEVRARSVTTDGADGQIEQPVVDEAMPVDSDSMLTRAADELLLNSVFASPSAGHAIRLANVPVNAPQRPISQPTEVVGAAYAADNQGVQNEEEAAPDSLDDALLVAAAQCVEEERRKSRAPLSPPPPSRTLTSDQDLFDAAPNVAAQPPPLSRTQLSDRALVDAAAAVAAPSPRAVQLVLPAPTATQLSDLALFEAAATVTARPSPRAEAVVPPPTTTQLSDEALMRAAAAVETTRAPPPLAAHERSELLFSSLSHPVAASLSMSAAAPADSMGVGDVLFERRLAERAGLVAPLTSTQRSLPVPTNVSLLTSGFRSYPQLQGLLKAVEGFGVKTTSKWTSTVTHLVVKTDEGGQVCLERTLKYIMAIAAKKMVVGQRWLADSVQAGQLLPEEDYEVRGDTLVPNSCGPRRSRVEPARLMTAFEFAFVDDFDTAALRRAQMEELLAYLGATVIKLPSAAHVNRRRFLLCPLGYESEETAARRLRERAAASGAVAVTADFVMDSATAYSVTDVEEYTV